MDIKIGLFSSDTSKDKVLVAGAGVIVLDNYCTYCKIKEDLTSGNYELDATFMIDINKDVYNSVQEEAILKVKTDYGYEIFRIAKVTCNKEYVDVFARQITIQDQLNIFLEDVRPTSLNGIATLRYALENSNEYKENKQYARDLEFRSNITQSSTSYFQNLNLFEALFNCDQSFMNRLGGEIKRRAYTTTIDKKIGLDRGFQVREGKNLTGFESTTNIDNVVTRIKPVGYNGITIDGYVQSGLMDKYATVKTRKIKYDNVKVKDENSDEGFDTLAQAQAELIRLAKLEYSEKHIDNLEASYRINFIDLTKTEEYKNYSMLETVDIGDSVSVYIDSLDLNLLVRVIAKTYNVLTEDVEEIELSNIDLSKYNPPSISDVINDINKIPESMQDILEQAKDHATNLINAGINGYVVVNKNEVLIMDTPSKDTARNVWRFNVNGLGFSSTGYNGRYETALTNDGKIVLNEATVQQINANLIRAGVIKDVLENMIINLETGEVSFKKGSIEGENLFINLNDGTIKTTKYDKYTDRTYGVTFGKGAIESDNYLTVSAIQEVCLETKYPNNRDWAKMFISNSTEQYRLNGISLHGNEIILSANDSEAPDALWFQGGSKFLRSVQILGDLTVTGNKNCLQKTKNFGNRLFYSVEDGQSWLTETGVGQKVDINKEVKVLYSDIYKECVNLEIPYVIEIYKEGFGDYNIKEKTKDYFILESDREEFSFSYCIKAKRKGFEDINLEEFTDERNIKMENTLLELGGLI